MRSLDEALTQFAYHPATPNTAPKHAAVRDVLADVVKSLWPLVPDGPEKTLAIRKIQEAGMYANLAIALSAPADTSETRSVARELPVITVSTPGPITPEDADSIKRQIQWGLDYIKARYGK